MTYLPVCNFDGHFWPKKKCMFYMAYGHGSTFDRWRLRFCPEHAATVDEDLSEHELSIANLTGTAVKAAASKCFSCGEPVDEGSWQCFVTGYPTQNQRKDYWFQIHGHCSLPSHLADGYSPAPH